MKPRLRLPAYGKQLLNERRHGRHPMVVHVIYGDQLHHGTRCELDCAGGFEPEKLPTLRPPASVGDPHPMLWVRPSEYKPWTIDWHAVVGAAVCVFDMREAGGGGRNFYEMLGEIGRFAGPVLVYRLEPFEIVGDCVALRWEFCWQAHITACGPSWRPHALPIWWPIETERENARRREKWDRLYAAHLEQRAAIAA